MIEFDKKYNPEEFSAFLRDFLPEDYREEEKDITNIEKCQFISRVRELGSSECLGVTVLEMSHAKSTDPRVTIATDAFKVLKNYGIEKALVIFKNDESNNYRFSYLTITLDLDEKNQITQTYSNARRYSFYLGEGAKVKTPTQQLVTKGKIRDVNDLLDRFSVEVVNKEFYLEIAKHFDELVDEEKQVLSLPFQNDSNVRKSFAVRLIGRLMFCWFLKQKKSQDGQLVPEEILSSSAVKNNYYHEILERLFFEVLNTNIEDRDIRNELFDKVPYLNGGLFNPQLEDYYELDRTTFASKHINTLNISDEWFKKFFELLELYNFTIDENTVFDQELSVDPEMLGRIFENLLAEINPETGSSERKRTGSFYTPRDIVEYMVDQSLLEYFKTKTGLSENKLKALISYDVNDDKEHPLNDSDRGEIVTAVDLLKILDPACGSGAYPIGVLQKVVYILQVADPDGKLWRDKKLENVPELYRQKIEQEFNSKTLDYIRKLEVIKNSIFGVDIQPIAVEVARLRCFLTLVVEDEIDDSRKNRGVEALPNLDFKFVCANTLISAPEQEGDDSEKLFGDDFREKLTIAVDRYFSSSGENKRTANNEIHKLIDGKVDEKLEHLNSLVSYGGNQVIEKAKAKANQKEIETNTRILRLWDSYKNIFESKPVDFFDTKYFFPSVKDGFDVVIGNPPYITIGGKQDTQTTSETKKIFSEIYCSYSYKANYYALFIEKALLLADKLGVVSYIIPRSILENSHADKIRKYILDNAEILKLVEFRYKVFDNAETGGNLVFVFRKQEDPQKQVENEIDVAIIANETDVGKIDYSVKRQADYLNSSGYIFSLSSGVSNDIVEKIRNTGFKLRQICDVKNGVNTGNAAKILLSDVNETNNHRKILEGKNIDKYKIDWGGLWINYDPELKNTIDLSKLETRQKKIDFALRKLENFTQEKIIIRQTADKPIAALDIEGFITRHSTHLILKKDDRVDLKCVLGVLNSKLMQFYYQHTIPEKGKTFAELKIVNLKELPIAVVNNKDVVFLVDRMLSQETGDSIDIVQSELDELVYDLYGLSEEEKDLIRSS